MQLIAWQHPQRGFISPAEFIPLAEQTGRIRDLTRWMLKRAIRNLAHFPAFQEPGRYLAVNISTLDLLDTDLPGWLATELVSAGVSPERLQLEVTESGLLASGTGPVEVHIPTRAEHPIRRLMSTLSGGVVQRSVSGNLATTRSSEERSKCGAQAGPNLIALQIWRWPRGAQPALRAQLSRITSNYQYRPKPAEADLPMGGAEAIAPPPGDHQQRCCSPAEPGNLGGQADLSCTPRTVQQRQNQSHSDPSRHAFRKFGAHAISPMLDRTAVG